MVRMELSEKEVRHVIRAREMSRIDKRLLPYLWICFAMMIMSLAGFALLLSGDSGQETYNLENGQVLRVRGNALLDLDGHRLQPTSDKPLLPPENYPLSIMFVVLASAGALGLLGMTGYEVYAGWKAQVVLLETYLQKDGEVRG